MILKKRLPLIFFILVFIFLAFIAFYLTQKSPESHPQNTEPYPIIDMHMNIFQWNKYGDPPPPNRITGKIPTARSNIEVIEDYIAEMDRYNIVLTVGSGELEMVKEMESHAQDRFLGGTEFPKYTSPVNKRIEKWPDISELRKLYETDQLQVMGEITAQYAGVALNDPKLEPYYALAEELDIPQITYVQKLEFLDDNTIRVERVFRTEEIVIIDTKLPALISVLKEINSPRYPSMAGVVDAYNKKDIIYLDAEALEADKSLLGLIGSQTEVWKIFVPERKGEHIQLSGTVEEMVRELCQNLKEDKIF